MIHRSTCFAFTMGYREQRPSGLWRLSNYWGWQRLAMGVFEGPCGPHPLPHLPVGEEPLGEQYGGLALPLALVLGSPLLWERGWG